MLALAHRRLRMTRGIMASFAFGVATITHLAGPSARGLVGKDATHCMDPFPLWKKWQQHQGNSGKQRGCARVADEKAR